MSRGSTGSSYEKKKGDILIYSASTTSIGYTYRDLVSSIQHNYQANGNAKTALYSYGYDAAERLTNSVEQDGLGSTLTLGGKRGHSRMA